MSGRVAAVLEREHPGSTQWVREHVHGGGSQGAEVWADASGRRVVVKRHPGADLGYFQVVVERVDRLRSAGVPAPHTSAVVDGPDVLLVHDHLPGIADPPLTTDLISDLLRIVGLAAGLADASSEGWPDLIGASLTTGLAGYCEHGSLLAFGDASRALLDRVKRVGTDPVVGRLAAPDLVHYDLHPDNVLSDDRRRVSGVVDWDAVRAGDRALDLAILAFTCSWRTSDEQLLEQLWDAFLATSTHDARVVYMHHVCLRLVDWFIRHGGGPGPTRTIDLANWALGVTQRGKFSMTTEGFA